MFEASKNLIHFPSKNRALINGLIFNEITAIIKSPNLGNTMSVDPELMRNLALLKKKVMKVKQEQFSISKTLFLERNEKDLSVEDMKGLTGWTGQKVSDFEKQSNQEFNSKELQIYCKALGIKMDSKLLGDDFLI